MGLQLPAQEAWPRSFRGVRLPARVARVEPMRFRSRLGFEQTVAFYRKVLAKKRHVRFIAAVSLPDVQVVHITSGLESSWWEGINISEIEGQVYIFFLERPVE